MSQEPSSRDADDDTQPEGQSPPVVSEPASPTEVTETTEVTEATETDALAGPPPPAGPAAPPPVGSSVPAPPADPTGGGISPPTLANPPAAGSPGDPPPPARPGGEQRPEQRRVAVGLAMVALALASGITGAITATALDDDDSTTSPAESLESTVAPASDGDEPPEAEEPLSRAAEAVLPSVVSIATEMGTGGSGVVISSDGQILTNNHVVTGAGRGDLSVTFSDGTTADAEVVGTDPASDLAVIQAEDVSGMTPAQLGRSGDLVVGDSVLAIGSPLGLEGSVSAGIVSAVNRAIDLGSPNSGPPFEEEDEDSPPTASAVIDAIQTDAAINPGNSGGPLINTDGEVVGINTAIASLATGLGDSSGSIGLGFAIPIDDARVIAEQLVEDGEATHAYMGVSIAEATERNGGDGRGAVVAGVEEGSPAEEAGIEEGDIITAVDGEAVRDPAALTSAIRRHAPGDEVTLTVTRDGDESEIQVTLGRLPTADS